ncbi:F-box/WD repeat-containing protein 7 [Dinochytrium kinnereticum]|nr:F-box/WD repeat-containing protein 7 [Dinochytrium kinnereticum]
MRTTQVDPLTALPPELALLILQLLTPTDLHILSQISRSWRRLSFQDKLWRPHCDAANFGNPNPSWTLLTGRPSRKIPSLRDHYWTRIKVLRNWRRGRARRCKVEGAHEDVVLGVGAYTESGVLTCASGSRDGEVKIFAVHSRYSKGLVRFLPHEGKAVSCVWVSGAEVVTGSYDGFVSVWTRGWTPNGIELEPKLKRRYPNDSSVTTIRVKKHLISSGTDSGKVYLWSNDTASPSHTTPVATYMVGNDSETPVLIGSVDFNDYAVCAGTSQPSVVIWSRMVDSGWIVSGSDDGTGAVLGVEWREVHASKPVFRRALKGHTAGVRCLEVRDEFVVTGSYDHVTIILWSLTSGTRITTFQGHKGDVNAIDCTEDAIVSVSDDRSIRAWDFRHPQKFSSSSLTALSSSTSTVKSFEFKKGGCKWIEEARYVLSRSAGCSLGVVELFERVCGRAGAGITREDLVAFKNEIRKEAMKGIDAVFGVAMTDGGGKGRRKGSKGFLVTLMPGKGYPEDNSEVDVVDE